MISRAGHAETFTVTNTNDGGGGSLRQAIADANGTANAGGAPDTIVFDIAGAGPHVIKPASALPEITDPVVFDGFSQGLGTPGDPSDDAKPNTDPDGNNADIRIMLDGSTAGDAVDGLVFTHALVGAASEVRGLAICKFGGNGITAAGSNVRVAGASIGVDPGGLISGNIGDGLAAFDARLVVGGRTDAERTVISGNRDGIRCEGSGATCQVEGTCIGTTYDCRAGMGNLGDGVHLIDTPASNIGETAEGAWVAIAANHGCGARLEGFDTENARFRNVRFGTDPTATIPIGGHRGACVDGGVLALFAGCSFAFHDDTGLATGPASGFTLVDESAFRENGRLGFDLLDDGVTLRNQLRITTVSPDASVAGGTVTNGDPLQTLLLQVCSNANPDPSGYGECETPYAVGSCLTDEAGNGSCTASGPPPPADQPYLSASLSAFALAPETFEFGLSYNRNETGIVPTINLTCPDAVDVGAPFSCTSEIGNTIMGRDAEAFYWEWALRPDVLVNDVFDNEVLSCSTDGSAASCTAAALPDGTTDVITIDLTAATPGTIRLCASAGADASPPATYCTTVEAAGPMGNRPPEAVCRDVTASADDLCLGNVGVDDVDGGSSDPDGAIVHRELSPEAPYRLGATAVTLTVVDDGGAVDACSATVTVIDDQPPAISCPDPIVVSIPDGQSAVVVTYPDPTPTDNCGTGGPECTPPSGSSFAAGETLVVCTTSDGLGNEASCEFTVTAEPPAANQPPVAVCTDVTVSADDLCLGNVGVDDVDGGSSDPDGAIVDRTTSPEAPYPLGATVVTLTVVDDGGATDACSATVTVIDDQPPAISCPGAIVVGIPDGQSATVVTYPDPAAADNCDVGSIECTPPSGSSFPAGETLVSCTIRDGFGNEASCGFTVTAEPPAANQPPVALCQDVTKTADAGGTAEVAPEEVDAGSFDPDGQIVDRTLDPTGPFPIGETPYTFTVTDDEGAFSTCGGTVTVGQEADVACAIRPPDATNFVDTVHSFIVVVTRDGQRVPGVTVSFEVPFDSGPNSGEFQQEQTDQNGEAGFGYVGDGGEGTDVLQASGTVDGQLFVCEAVKSWVFRVPAQCSIEPAVAANPLDTRHVVTATVADSPAPGLPREPVVGVPVTFRVIDGPNRGKSSQPSPTDADGRAAVEYAGDRGPGTDIIEASGEVVHGGRFRCTAVKLWIDSGTEVLDDLQEAVNELALLPGGSRGEKGLRPSLRQKIENAKRQLALPSGGKTAAIPHLKAFSRQLEHLAASPRLVGPNPAETLIRIADAIVEHFERFPE